MKLQQVLAEIVFPIMSSLPSRGRHHLLRLLGAGGRDSSQWKDCARPIRMLWDANIAAWVRCDLREWGGRWYYYCRQYYDRVLPAILRSTLRPGDAFIDVGANLGVHTLLASRLVGETGQVVAIEPSPTTAALLRAHLAINDRRNVSLFEVGLAETEGSGVLSQESLHSGTASMRARPSAAQCIEASIRVTTADSLLRDLSPSGDVFVKIDVEGLEFDVLKGMAGYLSNSAPRRVYVEVTPEWLEARGQSADDLLSFMQELGYAACLPTLRFRRVFLPTIEYVPLDRMPLDQSDILFELRAPRESLE